jgi:thioredoxin 1
MKIVKFSRTVCGPCNVLNMMLNQMLVEVDETRLLDTDEALKEAEEKFGVMSTPTTILFDDNGNELERVTGINPPLISGLFEKAGRL